MGEPTEYERFGKTVKVDVHDVVTYGQEMWNLARDSVPQSTNVMSEMPMLINEALNTMLEGQILPEGQQIAQFLNHRLSDFQYFFRDLGDGINNIGSAAIVVAEIYEGADNENGANLNDIGFVFGDPRANKPDGFRGNYETTDDQQRRLLEQSGQNVMALTGDEQFADTVSYPYGTIHTFSDGSQKHVHSSTRYEDGRLVYVTTTTIRGPNGNVISSTTKENYVASDGYTTVRNRTITENNGQRTTSDTTYNDNGTITVRNQTGDGPATTTTIDRDDHNENTVDAPVSDASEQLDTDGDRYTVQRYGTT